MPETSAATAAGRRVFPAQPGPVAGVAVGRLWRTDTDILPGSGRPPGVGGEEGPAPDGIPRAGAGPSDGDRVLGGSSADDGRSGEAARLAEAFAVVAGDLEAMARDLALRGRPEPAQIAETTFLIASDPDLRAAAESALASGACARDAVQLASEQFAALLEQLPDPTLAGRGADVRAVGRRLVAALTGARRGAAPTGPLVLVGHEVTADDLLMHADTVVAAATVVGGATSHAAIIARSLGVPIVFAIDPALLDTPDETEVLLDASQGSIVVRPDPMERGAALDGAAVARARRADLAAARHLPVRTRDGVEMTVLANVASAVDADLARGMGATGVGLLRTEMPFLTADQWPTRAEHLAALEPVLKALAGLPVTLRTLDFADDKLPPFLRRTLSGELQRSLPMMLAQPEAFLDQLHAILVAGVRAGVELRVMIPMVATADEMLVCRGLMARAAAEVGIAPPPVGAMIELPEAVSAVSEIAAVAGFLSLGTNDLTASILGVGRRDQALTTARVTEAPVLEAIAATARAGAEHGITVSVCGDAASDPSVLPALLAAGCRVFSVAPSMLDEVRVALRELDAAPPT